MTYLIMNWWLNCKFKVPLKVKLYGCKEYWVGVSVMLCKSTFLSLSVHWNFVNCDSLKNISSILQPTGNGWKISRVFNIVLSWTVLYFELHSVIILFFNVSKMMRIHMQKIVTKNILRDITKYLTLLLWYCVWRADGVVAPDKESVNRIWIFHYILVDNLLLTMASGTSVSSII